MIYCGPSTTVWNECTWIRWTVNLARVGARRDYTQSQVGCVWKASEPYPISQSPLLPSFLPFLLPNAFRRTREEVMGASYADITAAADFLVF